MLSFGNEDQKQERMVAQAWAIDQQLCSRFQVKLGNEKKLKAGCASLSRPTNYRGLRAFKI
jgi:hypothetical protein